MKQDKKPFTFTATAKPFTVQLDRPCAISGYSVGDKYASFYRRIPVKKGDTFRLDGMSVILNGVRLHPRARKPRVVVPHISWVAKRLRVVVFKEADFIYSKRLKRHTKRLGLPYWTACDVRSYHVACADSGPVEAVNGLIRQCLYTNLMAEEDKAKGYRVVRWRCLLPKNEVKEMEEKAKKTGFILDGVELPAFPKEWVRGLKRIRRKTQNA